MPQKIYEMVKTTEADSRIAAMERLGWSLARRSGDQLDTSLIFEKPDDE